MIKKVLFVDDEPNVLGGLRRMLRPQQKEWTSAFAEGGVQALAVLEKEPFDIIVSDMRMPGMSGVQLLEAVGQRFPRMVRIILTGQCDAESGLRALGVAHQMLYKPCDAENLKTTVARTCAFSKLLANEALQTIVTRRTSLPSAASLYRKIVEEIDSASPCLDRIGAIVSSDLGMVAKILHVLNSSFFGLRREVTNPRQAVTLLGLDTMRVLIRNVSIFSSCKASENESVVRALQAHAQRTCALAREIARAETLGAREIEHAGTAGLLHDIGKLILLDGRPHDYRIILDLAASSRRPLWEIERETFGASHAEVGACLLGLWGLPMPIVEAIAWHHRPSEAPLQTFGPTTAVHVANALLSGSAATLDHTHLERLKIVDRVPVWMDLAQSLETKLGRKGPRLIVSEAVT